MFDDGPGSRSSRGSDIGSRYAHHAGADITTSLQTFGTLPRRSKKRSSTTNSEHRNSSGPSTSGRDAASAPLETHFYYQVSLFCCVFRPAFECCTHPKAGRNTFFEPFSTFFVNVKPFSVISRLKSRKHLKMNKKNNIGALQVPDRTGNQTSGIPGRLGGVRKTYKPPPKKKVENSFKKVFGQACR